MRTTLGKCGFAQAYPATRRSAWLRGLTAAGIALTALGAMAGSAAAQGAPGPKLKTQLSDKRPDTVIMQWGGSITTDMAEQIKRDFAQWRGRIKRVQLKLSAGGLSVRQAEQVIQVLRDIKRTHALETSVEVNSQCYQMCVYVFAQGDVRFGALTSTWLFTQVTYNDAQTNKPVINVADSDKFIRQYLEPAGVSKAWLADLRTQWNNTKYWQTGGDLVAAKSGLITTTLGNRVPRKVVPPTARTAAR